MSFETDLVQIIRRSLDNAEVQYNCSMKTSDFVARYFEMSTRRISPTRRKVLLSKELHETLVKLSDEKHTERRKSALEAYSTVSLLRRLLQNGENVVRFLSKNIDDLIYSDGLLWDFGMHHFHLCREIGEAGFVKRSDYLLFAIVTNEIAYLIDVRPHRDPEKLGWVRQELLEIAYSNWPYLIEEHVLHGILGGSVTDEEKKELRRKNVNSVTVLGNKPVAPVGGGMMLDGSSSLCRLASMRLIHEIRRHQSYFDSQPPELRSVLEEKGIVFEGKMTFRLVELGSADSSGRLVEALKDDHCLSKTLSQFGFAIVEEKTRVPIVASIRE